MKAVKASLLTALALGTFVALAPVSRAQTDKPETKPDQPPAGQRARRPGGGQQIDAIAERLKLTDDQKKQLQPILREEAGKLRDLRADTALTTEERREKAKGVREQYLAKIKPILSADQFEQYKKMREQAGTRGGQRGVRQGGDAKPPADPNAAPKDEKK